MQDEGTYSGRQLDGFNRHTFWLQPSKIHPLYTTYEFQSLPFGPCSAPRDFTALHTLKGTHTWCYSMPHKEEVSLIAATKGYAH